MSVVIPCHNYAHFLSEAVGSVLSQQGVAAQVLVIDDASTDATPEVCAALAADPRVSVERHSKNLGHIATYNEGLQWASGTYTALLSADDMLAPGALARAAAVLDAHPGVGLAYGRAVYFRDVVPRPRVHRGRYQLWTGPQWLESRCRIGRIKLISPEAVVRTDVQRTVGGYRPSLPHSGDNEMWMRFAQQADVAFVSADQAFYRVHGQNMSLTRFGSELADAQHRKAAFDSALAAQPALHRLAMEALARDVLWQVCRAYDHGAVARMPVEAMLEFATALLPAGVKPAEMRALRWRRRIGPSASRSISPLITPALVPRRLRRLRLEFGSQWLLNIR